MAQSRHGSAKQSPQKHLSVALLIAISDSRAEVLANIMTL
jgi:hypothetical protein